MEDKKFIDEIIAAKKFLFAMTDKVRYILVTNDDTDRTRPVENGRYDIYVTSARHIDGVYIPVLPAVLHEYGHILFSQLDYGENYLAKYAGVEEVVVNSLLIEKRFPAAYKDLADIYVVQEGIDWVMDQLKNTTRNGIVINTKGIESEERDKLPGLFEQAKKFKKLSDRTEIYDEILRIVGQKAKQQINPSTFKGLIAAMLDASNQWCSLTTGGDATADIHEAEGLNSILRDLQDAIEKEMKQQGLSNPATSFTKYDDVTFVEPDPDLAKQIRLMLHARSGENRQFVHNLPSGRISIKHPHKLNMAMRGVSTTYHKARKEGEIDVCIGVLVDTSGSMSYLMDEAAKAAASIFSALDKECNVIIGTFGDKLYYSNKGMPDVHSGGNTPGYSATNLFQKLIESQKETKKYILVLSDFEFTDQPSTFGTSVPVFGLGYRAAKIPAGIHFCGEATAENIVKFFLNKVK